MKCSKIWRTKNKPEGILQIVHGMTEYIGRYEALAQYFNELGYVVCGYDLEGHGDNLYPGIPALYMESGRSQSIIWNNTGKCSKNS